MKIVESAIACRIIKHHATTSKGRRMALNLGSEDEFTEFKKTTKLVNEGADSIASILNKHHFGVLYFGVAPNGEGVGQDVSEKTLRDIGQAIECRIEPSITPTITRLSAEDRIYIRVDFHGTDAPYSSSGKYRIRVADEDRLMSRGELLHLLHDENQKEEPWDRRLSKKLPADVNTDQLIRYLKRGHEAGRISFDFSTTQDALQRLELLDSGRLTNAGAILFCTSDEIMLKMAIFATDARINILDMKQERGTLFELTEKAEYYLKKNIRWRFELTGAMQRNEIPEIPLAALREGIINAFCHRDYRSPLAVQIDIFGDKIELFSPGHFPCEISPQDCLEGNSPFSRSPNTLLAQALYRSKDIESYGTGIPRIQSLCNEAGVTVEYEELPQGIILRFNRPFGPSPDQSQSPNNMPINADKMPINADKMPISTSFALEKTAALEQTTHAFVILELLQKKGSAKSSEIAEALGLKQRAARGALSKLVEKGFVETYGGNRNRRYRLPEESATTSPNHGPTDVTTL